MNKFKEAIKNEELRVLLIGNENRFIVNTLINTLKANDVEVRCVSPNVTELSHIKDVPRDCILYLDEGEEKDFVEVDMYLRDNYGDEDIRIYLIGTHDQFQYTFKNIAESKFAACFERPFQASDVIEALKNGASHDEKEKEKKRILVVDDDATMLRMIKNWLSEKYTVHMVTSGMNAIQFLAKNEVDLVLLDYEMPVTSGPQVLEMMKSEPQTASIPVMFLTAKGDKESVMSVLALKPEKYLLKTLKQNELIANIDEFFAKQK
ncbi:MAG: response regulator [Lachnospiraceae bacterium]|nr:response regulator [Lachnospiraceae bacterium]